MKKILLVFTILLSLISLISCEIKGTNNETKLEEIELGLYPQNKVTDINLVNELILLEEIEDNVVFHEATNKKYFRYNNEFYEVSPVVWEPVKVGNEILYISKVILDAQVFLKEEYVKVIGNSESIKPGVPSGTYSNNYEYSDLREWLNGPFFTSTFTLEEQEKLAKIKYDGLSDYVYTLSKDDITNLIHPSALVTDYAKESGCEVFFSDGTDKTFDGRGLSWLRDGNDIHKYRVYALNNEGLVYEYVDCYYKGVGVRPVIKLK